MVETWNLPFEMLGRVGSCVRWRPHAVEVPRQPITRPICGGLWRCDNAQCGCCRRNHRKVNRCPKDEQSRLSYRRDRSVSHRIFAQTLENNTYLKAASLNFVKSLSRPTCSSKKIPQRSVPAAGSQIASLQTDDFYS